MGNASSEDLACVTRVLRGDEAAAAALVERLRPLVVAMVRRRLPERVDEADLVQSVFLRVFRNLEQYAGKAPLEHWAPRSAVNTCLNELRYEANRPELRRADLPREQDEVLDLLSCSDADLPVDRQVAARELVDKLLGRLPPAQKFEDEWLEVHRSELSLTDEQLQAVRPLLRKPVEDLSGIWYRAIMTMGAVQESVDRAIEPFLNDQQR